MEVALRRADDDDAERLAIAPRLGDEGLEEIEPRVHRPRGEEHLRDVVLIAPKLLADHVHARDQPAEDQILGIHGEGEAFLGLAGDRVLVAQDQGPRHDRVVEVVVHASFVIPPGLTVE